VQAVDIWSAAEAAALLFARSLVAAENQLDRQRQLLTVPQGNVDHRCCWLLLLDYCTLAWMAI
jgi:hypothetical protein